jgi:DNA-binding MarR family transcriptional regulator
MPNLSLAEFADRLNQIVPVFMREFLRRQENELSKGKISLPQVFILCFLEEETEVRMTDLAKFMKVTTAATTGIVDRLVKSGYALRSFDPLDRRIIRIKISEKGKGLIRKVNQQRRNMVMDIFGKISPKERQVYLKILTHIYEILTQEQK